MPANPWGLIGPLPDDAGLSEQEARRLADEERARNASLYLRDTPRNEGRPNSAIANDIAKYGPAPGDFDGRGFADMGDIISLIPTEYDDIMSEIKYQQRMKEINDEYKKTAPPGGIAVVPALDGVHERDLGLSPPEQVKPLKPGEKPKARQMPIPTAPIPGAGLSTSEPFTQAARDFGLPETAAREVAPQYRQQAEQASGVSMLEQYLMAEDIKRMEEVKKKVLMRAISPGGLPEPTVKGPRNTPDSGVRG